MGSDCPGRYPHGTDLSHGKCSTKRSPFAKLELNDDFNGGQPVTVTNTAPAAGSGIMKQSVTSYNTSTNYISRRMIALPTQVDVSGKNDLGGVELVSRQMFYYDENGYTGTGQNISPTQH